MALIDKLLALDFLQSFLAYVYGLSQSEIQIVVAITLLLILWLTYRMFGAPATIILVSVMFIVYIVWVNKTFDHMASERNSFDERMEGIQAEMDKATP